MAKEKKAGRKGKKVRKGRKHESVKTHSMYELKGSELARKRKPCPRCGEGTWLSIHKNRAYCGRCSYTLFERSK
jgi:small subunit ribosomal protein S27Ae